MACLVVGLSGVGVEVAKALLLSGACTSLALHDDDGVVAAGESASNFCVRAEDAGRRRVDLALSRLRPLNPHCVLRAHAGGVLREGGLAAYDVVVFANRRRDQLIRFNEYCRAIGVTFIAVESRGPAASAFTDIEFPSGRGRGASLCTRITNPLAGRPASSSAVHVALMGVHAFAEANGHLPRASNPSQVAEAVALAKAFQQDNAELTPLVFDPHVAHVVASFARDEFLPVSMVAAGFAAAQAVLALTVRRGGADAAAAATATAALPPIPAVLPMTAPWQRRPTATANGAGSPLGSLDPECKRRQMKRSGTPAARQFGQSS